MRLAVTASAAVIVSLFSLTSIAFAASNSPLVTDPNYHYSDRLYGNNIVYVDNKAGDAQLYVYNFKTGKTLQITHDSPSAIGSANIYGNYVVYNDARTGSSQIYLYNLGTNTQQAITTEPGYRANAAMWGTKVVWQDNTIPANGNDIFMYDIKTHVTTQITNDTADEYNPSIGDKWMSFTRGDGTAADVYAYNLSTKRTQQVTSVVGAQDHSVIYGNSIAWDDQRRGTDDSDVYTMNLTKLREQIISNTSDFAGRPEIYGQNIAYVDFSSNQGDIEEYNLKSKLTTQITSDPTTQSSPSIYAKHIIWLDYRNGQPEIYGN